MAAMLKVNQAIRENKKISFRYQKYTIKDRTQQVDRRGGAAYKISPFKLIISDGYRRYKFLVRRHTIVQIVAVFAHRNTWFFPVTECYGNKS